MVIPLFEKEKKNHQKKSLLGRKIFIRQKFVEKIKVQKQFSRKNNFVKKVHFTILQIFLS